MRFILLLSLSMALTLLQRESVFGLDNNRPLRFLPEDRRIIEDFYRSDKKVEKKGLPPGLAKRGGNLPPGLQKKLERDGQLPPGLQKRVKPLPADLDRRLTPLPAYCERVIVERDVVLLDRRSQRILDIIENVTGLVAGQ